MILITGGCGFIGRHLCTRLHQGGQSVRVLDCLAEQVHGLVPDLSWAETMGIEIVRGSVCDQGACQKALEGVKSVVHLAAETGTGQSMYELRRYVDTNVTGTAVLLEECIRSGLKKFVLTSSRAVYGEGSWACPNCGPVHPPMRNRGAGAPASWNPACPQCEAFTTGVLPTNEREAVTPTSVYGASKASQEQLVALVGAATGMSCTILRLFNVYGPGQALSNPYTGVLAVFVNRARAGKAIDLYEDGEIVRDFVYVDDAVTSIVEALASTHGGPINIGSGQAVTIRAVAEAVVGLTSSASAMTVTGKTRIGDVRGLVADVGLAGQALRWRPGTSFKEGLRLFIEGTSGSGYDDLYEKSLEELQSRGLYR